MKKRKLDVDERLCISKVWGLLLVVAFFGPAAYFAYLGDYVLTGFFIAAGISAFSGYRMGAVAILASIGAFAAAIAFAPSLGISQEVRFASWFGTTGLLNRFLTIGVVGIAIALAVTTVTCIAANRFFRSRPLLSGCNRWLGLGVGCAEGVLAVVFFLGGMVILEPIEKDRVGERSADDTRGHLISKVVLASSEYTRASRVGPLIEQYNPFVRFPKLNKVEQVERSVKLLGDPARIEQLMYHPSIKQLQERPEVRTAVNQVMQSPEIKSVLRSGRPLDRKATMTLLRHPAILDLVDQPGFVEEAKKVIYDTKIIEI